MQIGKSLVLYRAEEHRVLELLKNLALGRVFQHMQACTPYAAYAPYAAYSLHTRARPLLTM